MASPGQRKGGVGTLWPLLINILDVHDAGTNVGDNLCIKKLHCE